MRARARSQQRCRCRRSCAPGAPLDLPDCLLPARYRQHRTRPGLQHLAPPCQRCALHSCDRLPSTRRALSLTLSPLQIPPSPDVGERGSYDVDEHLLSPQEVAAKFGTSVDWGSIPGSKGLASEQASGGVAACCMPPLAAAMRAPAAACTPAVLACGGPAAARGCMRPRMRRRGRAARMRRLKPPPCKLRQVKALRELHGLNRLTPPKERSEIVKFLLQVSV